MNWVSIKDRLPDIEFTHHRSEKMLVWLSTGGWIEAIYHGNGDWQATDNENTYYGDMVTHWCEVTPPNNN